MPNAKLSKTPAKPPSFKPDAVQFCSQGLVLNYQDEACRFHLGAIDSPISGRGLSVVYGKISSGWPVIRYTGPILTEEQATQVWETRRKSRKPLRVEFFQLDEGRIIDGQKALAALVNHSCEPNLETYIDGAKDLILFYALRDIQKGEELTVNYRLQSVVEGAHPCLCGAPTCKGWMA